MRLMMFAVAAAGLAVSACGGAGGGKSELVEACVADGEDKAQCECIATELEANLDEDVFRAMVLGAQGKEAEAEEIMNDMPMDKQFSVATGAMAAMMKCGVSTPN